MLEEQISKDYIQAMKDRNSIKSSTLSFLRAALKNVRIDKRVEAIEEADVVAVIQKQVKQRLASIEQYGKGGRQDLVAKEQAELEILKSYLPKEMSESDLTVIVQAAVKEAQATSMKDMGQVMKVLMPKVAGKAHNKMVSDVVKKVLAGL